jgi:hypothetical protein
MEPLVWPGNTKGGKYHCTVDLLLFDWFGISCMTTDNFFIYLKNRLMQTSQRGGQWYSDTSPFSIPWFGCCPDQQINGKITWFINAEIFESNQEKNVNLLNNLRKYFKLKNWERLSRKEEHFRRKKYWSE